MWTEESVEQLITLYKEHPVLWDPKNKNYKNRSRKDEALKEIGNVMCLEVVEVERKINVLNTQFRRTHKKVLRLRESGLPTEEIENGLWYGYKLLLFLEKRYYPRRSAPMTRVIQDLEAKSNSSRVVQQFSVANITGVDDYDSSSDSNLTGIKIEYPDVSPNKKPRLEDENSEKDATTTSTVILNKDDVSLKDECDVYGELLAIKLRNFDERTRYSLMHEIDNLIFRTRMDYN